MSVKHKLLHGALILTGAGLLSRLMGFFFRIFLSHAFGEENVGLYQLIFPVYSLCLALGTSGLQTALSRTVARKTSLGKPGEARTALCAALALTVSLSVVELLFIQRYSSVISSRFLGDPRCEELLTIISYALPCAAIHSCICGYSYGLQQSTLPAISQLIEQTVRIFSVVLLFSLFRQTGKTPSISLAAAGIVIGELSSALFSVRFFPRRKGKDRHTGSIPARHWRIRQRVVCSFPASHSKQGMCITASERREAASIPAMLKLCRYSTKESLVLYGVLTGMALPLYPFSLCRH